MLVHENALVKIRKEIPLDRAALIGCGVTTGLGAALNTAQVRPGESCAVIGCGGVGLAAIQGCRIAGASRIVAIDTVPWKLELARTLGATDAVDASKGDPVMAVLGATGGVDYAFECIGHPTTIAQSWMCVRKGGTAVVVGVSRPTDQVTLPAFLMPFVEKTLTGSMYGSARPSVDFPRLLNLYKAHRLKLDELVTATYRIDEAQRAFDDMQKGLNARGVIVM
jgi:S-(hydroxymethyl)glutathione dehydrogenase/alcohol dehydrogenase